MLTFYSNQNDVSNRSKRRPAPKIANFRTARTPKRASAPKKNDATFATPRRLSRPPLIKVGGNGDRFAQFSAERNDPKALVVLVLAQQNELGVDLDDVGVE